MDKPTSGDSSSNGTGQLSKIPTGSKAVAGSAQGGISTPFTDAVVTSVGSGSKGGKK